MEVLRDKDISAMRDRAPAHLWKTPAYFQLRVSLY
jgi:hypothetical protein